MIVSRVILLSSLVVLSLFIGVVQSHAQSSGAEIYVGTAAPMPIIDGQWESQRGEWGNTIEYTLPIGAQNANSNPSIRMVHDNATLYGLIDIPSDLETPNNHGLVVLTFFNISAMNQNVTVSFSTNQTKLVSVHVTSPMASSILPHIRVATSFSTTIHSQSKHRVWEFSIQLCPFIGRKVLDGAHFGLQVTVTDSTGNVVSLEDANQTGEIFFLANVA